MRIDNLLGNSLSAQITELTPLVKDASNQFGNMMKDAISSTDGKNNGLSDLEPMVKDVTNKLDQIGKDSLASIDKKQTQAAAATSAPVYQQGGVNFGDTINQAIASVNDKQLQADEFAKKIASGEPVEIHQAIIAMQQASTALQFTVQVRNKVLEAYQEIMKMQV